MPTKSTATLEPPEPQATEHLQAAEHFTRNTDDAAIHDKRPKFSIIPLERIQPSPLNPRKHFDEAALQELADSITAHGIQQPIVVRQHVENAGAAGGVVTYSIVMGERRWRAARLAGMTTVPAIVRTDLTDLKHAELAMEENVRRRDLSAIEEANGYAKLMEFGKTQSEIGESVGVGQSRISNLIRLLELPRDVQERIGSGEIKPGHGIALLRWKDWPAAVSLIAGNIESYNFSVRTLETGEGLGYSIKADLGNTRLTGKLIGTSVSDYRVTPVCQKCPFHAYFHGVCLNPPHYTELVAAQDEKEKKAREDALAEKHKTQQLARTAAKHSGQGYPPEAMERLAEEDKAEEDKAEETQTEAKPKPAPNGLPLLNSLPRDSYEMLNQKRPSGCNGHCDCSGLALNAAGQHVSICTKPRRFANHIESDRALKSSEEMMVKKQLLADCLLITGGINPGDEAFKLALAVDALLVERDYKLRQEIFLRHGVLDRVTPKLWPTYGMWDTKEGEIRKRLSELCALGARVLITIAAEVVVCRDLVKAGDTTQGDTSTAGNKARWFYDQRFGSADVPAEPQNVGISSEPADAPGAFEKAIPAGEVCAGCKNPFAGSLDWFDIMPSRDGSGWLDSLSDEEGVFRVCFNCVTGLPLETTAADCLRCDQTFQPSLSPKKWTRTANGDLWRRDGALVTRRGSFYCPECGPDVQICRGCGCTHENACDGGCDWAETDASDLANCLCTACKPAEAALVTEDGETDPATLCPATSERCDKVCHSEDPCALQEQNQGQSITNAEWAYSHPDGLPASFAVGDAVEVRYEDKWLAGSVVSRDEQNALRYVLVTGDSGPGLFGLEAIRPAAGEATHA